MTQKIHNEFSDVFSGIKCFAGTFQLQVREGSLPYQTLPGRVPYVLQEPLEDELECLLKQQITVPLSVDEMSEWCNSFVLVPEENGMV